MSTITLARDLPGCPAGTVFTADKAGNFRDPSGKHWISPRAVEETTGLVEPPPVEAGAVYHYIDDAGAVLSAEWADTKRDAARKDVGNYFETPEAAKAASAKTAESRGGKPLDDALAAEVAAEKPLADAVAAKG